MACEGVRKDLSADVPAVSCVFRNMQMLCHIRYFQSMRPAGRAFVSRGGFSQGRNT